MGLWYHLCPASSYNPAVEAIYMLSVGLHCQWATCPPRAILRPDQLKRCREPDIFTANSAGSVSAHAVISEQKQTALLWASLSNTLMCIFFWPCVTGSDLRSAQIEVNCSHIVRRLLDNNCWISFLNNSTYHLCSCVEYWFHLISQEFIHCLVKGMHYISLYLLHISVYTLTH